jgi:hypothetical protein
VEKPSWADSLIYLLMESPYTLTYRIKEQKIFISDKEYVTKLSFHLYFSDIFWEKFASFHNLISNDKIESNSINSGELEIPLALFKKKALVNLNVLDMQGSSIATIKREEARRKTSKFMNLIITKNLSTSFSLSKFLHLIEAMVFCTPSLIAERRRLFFNTFQPESNDPNEIEIAFLCNELRKYGVSYDNVKGLFKKYNQDSTTVFNEIKRLGNVFNETENLKPLASLALNPLSCFRDYFLVCGKQLDEVLPLFLQECHDYIVWIENVIKSDKPVNIVNDTLCLMKNLFESFYLIIVLPYNSNKRHYMIKIEMLEPYTEVPASNGPWKKAFAMSKHRLVSHTWQLKLGMLGCNTAYHFEFSTKDPSLNVLDHCIYDNADNAIYKTDQIFGEAECDKGHLHLYTTQHNFFINEKWLDVNNLRLCFCVKPDWMRIFFYLMIIFGEIVGFLALLKDNFEYYAFQCNIIDYQLLPYLPLFTVAVTLGLIYKTGELSDSVTRKWRVTFVAGLVIYILSILLTFVIHWVSLSRFLCVLIAQVGLLSFSGYMIWNIVLPENIGYEFIVDFCVIIAFFIMSWFLMDIVFLFVLSFYILLVLGKIIDYILDNTRYLNII